MAELKVPVAPYNFVPFPPKILVRYEVPEDLPSHERTCPDLLSGQIHVTMTAQTPVMVGSGRSSDIREKFFYQNAAGEYAIPGSSVKGMVRQNMQVLGFGLFRPGEEVADTRIFFRQMASARTSAKAELQGLYKAALSIGDDRFAKPENVKAGYLHRENGSYYIRPIQGEIQFAHEKDFGFLRGTTFEEQPCWYKPSECFVKGLSCRPEVGYKRGTLLSTGKVGKQDKVHYVFPLEDLNAAKIPIDKQDELAYRLDYENRKNQLGSSRQHFALPEKDGDSVAVFYLQYDGHTWFGRSRYLRIGHLHKITEGLPEEHRSQAESGLVLDMPRSILGYVSDNGAYRSRVAFGDLTLQGDLPQQKDERVTLNGAKPSFFAGYVQEGKHYSENGFQLNGIKQYWLKENAHPAHGDKEKVDSIIYPLPTGSVFSGVIRYRNLDPYELGLLLWSLRLDEGCFQSIGMGKPYGFGRMKLTIKLIRQQPTYTSFTSPAPKPDNDAAIDDFVNKYICFAQQELNIKDLREASGIREFLYMHRQLQSKDGFSYMELKDYKNLPGCLKTVSEYMEQPLQPHEGKAAQLHNNLASPRYEDKILKCKDCGSDFVFPAVEQAFYAERGLFEPQRCKACRDARKNGTRTAFPRELFTAVCANCGGVAKVPFQPQPGRPVYCRECLAQMRAKG